MKRRVVLLLSAMITATLCGCGEEPAKGTVTQQSTVAESGAEQKGEEAVSAEEQKEENAGSEEDRLTPGKTVGYVYTSEWAGFRIVFDDKWELADEEELAGLNGTATEQLTDETLKEAVEKSGLVYDLYARNSLTGSSMNTIYQKINPLAGITVDEEALVDSNLSSYAELLLKSGYDEVSVSEKRKMKIAGKERPVIYCEAQIQGLHLQMVQFFEIKGSYILCTSVGWLQELADDTTLDDLLDMFEPIEK